MKKAAPDKSVGPWAKEKLDALGQYLNYYTTVLKNQGHWLRGTIFVDAFAGPGLSPVRTKLKPSDTASLFAAEGDPDPAQVASSSRVRRASPSRSPIRSAPTSSSTVTPSALSS
jgi:hypothetical protein